jgi:hypothetical protein
MYNLKTAAYWGTKVLIVFWMLASGTSALLKAEFIVEAITRLGYPLYFVTFLGIAKVLGAIAIALPVPKTLKEWTYAGVTFELLASAYSYASVGDPFSEIIKPVILLMLIATSYLTWKSRSYQEGPYWDLRKYRILKRYRDRYFSRGKNCHSENVGQQ